MAELSSNRKIEEALSLLNEAARDKKEEFGRILTDKYEHIKDTLTQVAMDKKEIIENATRIAKDRIEEGQEYITEVAQDIDKQVRKNPWPYIGGVAVTALLVGFILGNSKK